MAKQLGRKGKRARKPHVLSVDVSPEVISPGRIMEGSVFGLGMAEYWELTDRLLALVNQDMMKLTKRYMLDSLGRPWSVMVDRSGIYLIGDTEWRPSALTRPQNPLWTA